MKDTPRSQNVCPKQPRIAEIARQRPQERMTALNHYLEVEWLTEACHRVRRNRPREWTGKPSRNTKSTWKPTFPDCWTAPRAEPTWLPRSSGCRCRRTTGSPDPSAYPRPKTKCWVGPSSGCWSRVTRRRSTTFRMGFGLDDRLSKRWQPFGNRPARGECAGCWKWTAGSILTASVGSAGSS